MRLINWLFGFEKKSAVPNFTCATCPRMINTSTMRLDEHCRLVCGNCYIDNASEEEIACVLHDVAVECAGSAISARTETI